MPIWRVDSEEPKKVHETDLKKENLLENNLENWIIDDPSILGESLLIIGRQVTIPDLNDRLDILTLDSSGNTVIIETKRGKLKNPAEMQALRYASYISKWRYEDLEKVAKNFLGSEDDDFNFNEIYENFCRDIGIDDTPDINLDQRIILVGCEIRERLGSVALWLNDHNVNIKVIDVTLFKDGGSTYLHPSQLIPTPTSKFIGVGKRSKTEESRPWKEDGKSWHLDKRCSTKTRGILLELNNLIKDNFEVEGPRWGQKGYVAYRIANYNSWFIRGRQTQIRFSLIVQKDSFTGTELADRLGIAEYDVEEQLSDKLSLGNSVSIQERNEDTDKVIIRIKEDFDINSDEFLSFLKEAYDSIPKHWK